MGWFSKKEDAINWIELTSEAQLDELIEKSNEIPVVLFKHSTRCSISSMAKSKFERNWKYEGEAIPVYLDLIAYRPISNKIAEITKVEHQSPQAIVLKNGEVVYNASHNSIDVSDIF